MTAILRLLFDVVLALVAPRAVLVTENLLLRQQLIVARRRVKRPRFRRFDRWLIGALAGRFRRFVEVVLLVKPETVIGWHRAGWRILWRWRSRRPSGRPPVDSDLRSLIRRMWRENPTWGEDRIAGELAKLGYRVSPRTVAKYRPAGLRRQRGQRWMTFIRNHLDETWACDFFVIVTARFRVLYVFVVLSLGRRRLVHFGVTARPSAGWAAQCIVEATAVTDQVPRFVVHDRDSIYGSQFRSRIRGLGTRLLATPPRTPQANAFCERVIGTLRRDCLDHIIVRDELHAERAIGAYLGYYQGRPHRGLRMQPPDGGRHLAPRRPTRGTRIATTPILGGLHHRYGFVPVGLAPTSNEAVA
jgi:putative transposase